ncbi:Sulfatase [Sinomicrobium oceani]|uniref:Sulfatase n=1 Tax=Sinomicrobium oceani TaxID=1150368 RepID=A0A1K1RQH6_9FLAO|nr:sulfatase [Sinomicrobium oceani]SFW74345.1 Sulfatase [Sinomicrobium oceani]
MRIKVISLLFTVSFHIAFAQKRPNIVIFISDDQSQMDVGCYGNSQVKTPHMDQLAKEGMKFNAAFAASPMCVPSRSTMLTGLYPFSNGAQMNHFALRPGTKTLPEYLKKLGYYVAIAGKIDVYPKPPFDKHIGEYFGKYLPEENRDDPRNETVHFISDYFRDAPDKPLCLIVATWLPHVPWKEGGEWDPDKLTLPGYLVDTPETRKAMAAYYHSISRADKMLGKMVNAVNDAGEEANTIFMFFSDQGVQFPGAKWTTYNEGLRVPFIVKWPGKIAQGTQTDAMISLTDLTPTLIDLAGGEVVEGLDGRSFREVILGKQDKHREYIFAESSMEPQYWYNYVPSRTIVEKTGYHYIRNYNPGVPFVTHIDDVERNMYYFDSWEKRAEKDSLARFLLDRYRFRPPEELYDLNSDRWELHSLAGDDTYLATRKRLRKILADVLDKQGETEDQIRHGTLPDFYDRSYEVRQGISVNDMSFEKKLWEPEEKLYITAYIRGMDHDGVIAEYFNRFKIFVKSGTLGIAFDEEEIFYSAKVDAQEGQLVLALEKTGDFELKYAGEILIKNRVGGDYTGIRSGYVSCGLSREKNPGQGMPLYFGGEINNFRVSLDALSRTPD